MLLEIDNLWVHYGDAVAVAGVNLKVKDSFVVSIIGANGAGKTTILRTTSGLITPTQGHILFSGEKINDLRPDAIVKLGIIHCPEGRHVFPSLSVIENLLMGAYLRGDKKGIQKDIDWILDLFPLFKTRRQQLAATLSGGEQQMLVLGRAMMGQPKLLLLDEPSLGLSPLLVDEVSRIISSFHQKGIGILLVEQNVKMVLSLAQWVYVMETGRICIEGEAEKLLRDGSVEKAYLGQVNPKSI